MVRFHPFPTFYKKGIIEMAKIITFGEIMLRLSPPGHLRFVQANSFDVIYGGGEANVAVSLANYGHESVYVTKLPKHEIGQSAVNALRRYGVNTDHIARGGDRIGIYYLEHGASMRPSKVIYDRAGSSIAEAEPQDFDFEAIFKDADWFHFTGITPALSKKSALVLEEALKAAKKHNVTVSCDLNYRKKLWTEEEAQKVMTHLMQYVDVCIGNEEDAEKCLGFKPKGTDVKTGKLSLEGYKEIFREYENSIQICRDFLREAIPQATAVGARGTTDKNSTLESEIRIVDRVGSGTIASVIHGLLTKQNFKEALNSQSARAPWHTIFGDFNLVSAAEVET